MSQSLNQVGVDNYKASYPFQTVKYFCLILVDMVLILTLQSVRIID